MIDQCSGFELLSPKNSGWVKNRHQAPVPTRHVIWDHELASIRVISTIEFTGQDRGVEFHLSVSERGGRYPKPWIIEKVRKDFGAELCELDDHGSKVAHLWMPVDPDKRGDCDCK